MVRVAPSRGQLAVPDVLIRLLLTTFLCFCCLPVSWSCLLRRPFQATSIPNCFLAGDWVKGVSHGEPCGTAYYYIVCTCSTLVDGVRCILTSSSSSSRNSGSQLQGAWEPTLQHMLHKQQ